jgi:hypothetical protein
MFILERALVGQMRYFFTLYYSDGIKDRFVLIIAEGFLFKLSSIIIVFSFSANYKKGKSFLFEPR